MPYTFGANTGDDVNTSTVGVTVGATNTSVLVFGWWRPTTLTATRGLWSSGDIVGAEIDSTTDELRLRTDNTTDGQWTTSGVDLVVDQWHFLAFLGSFNNTNGAAWRVWRATIESPVTEVTVSVATARSGNFVGSATLTVGNKGITGTLAFQGDIAGVGYLATTVAASETLHPLAVSSYGSAFTQAQADRVRDNLVLPAYRGDLARLVVPNRLGVLSSGYWRGEAGSNNERFTMDQAALGDVAVAVGTTTVAASAHPRPVLAGSKFSSAPHLLTAL